MAQNSSRIQWSSEDVDIKLKQIMASALAHFSRILFSSIDLNTHCTACFTTCYETAEEYVPLEGDNLPSLVGGANIAGEFARGFLSERIIQPSRRLPQGRGRDARTRRLVVTSIGNFLHKVVNLDLIDAQNRSQAHSENLKDREREIAQTVRYEQNQPPSLALDSSK